MLRCLRGEKIQIRRITDYGISKLPIFMYPRARETAPPEPRSGFRPRRRFLFYEFRLGANDGDVGGAGTRYGVDVTTPRSPHPPPR